ncbi:NADH:ubiquinone reductase (Na(+)-transporting) subunit F [Aliikangiella sp. G2MR2-5]|uniref:NADH:ubiquinone reductase (Na(+)-transporting) subunit F n=1 Tax=Aliikangiella sp. G2MR2-5 TaxID=2788943 RepID=UPI0018ABE789|nr:NADH:ubiquinone reductase (Na(+)-transporting) subunit F [Aliikangiella sp. G2MR2-5]
MKFAFFLRKYHKWLALIVGVQALVWCVSGLYMVSVHIDMIHGDHLVKHRSKQVISSSIQPLSEEFLSSFPEVQTISLKSGERGSEYHLKTAKQLFRLDATSLEMLPEVSESEIRQAAQALYAGKAKIHTVKRLQSFPRELGGREKPIWQVSYDDWLNSTLYFTEDTGELRSKRTDLWRWFDFLWMLHIMDYQERENPHNRLLMFAASLGLLLAVTGLGLLFYSFKNQSAQKKGLLNGIKKIHKWVAVFLGIQLGLWMLSGLMFNLLSPQKVSGRYLLTKSSEERWQVEDYQQLSNISNLLNNYPQATLVETGMFLSKPVFIVTQADKSLLVDAHSLQPVRINEVRVLKLLETRYQGDGQLKSLILETQRTTENRKYALPVWKASYNGEENAAVYISAEKGTLLGAKTDTWRLFDLFWMLHIMDYSERDNMNNALVIFAAGSTLFIALTGIWLIFSVFRWQDFKFWAHHRRFPVLLKAKNGYSGEVFALSCRSIFESLSKSGFNIPSNCGGGGSCGLCSVRVEGDAPLTSADKIMISPERLAEGYRLSCQLKPETGLSIELPSQVLAGQLLTCRVESTRLVTPLIKEICLSFVDGKTLEFESGEYVMLHIPEGKTDLAAIEVPEQFEQSWSALNLRKVQSVRTDNIQRAYSMANPPVENDRILLNVRLAISKKAGEADSGFDIHLAGKASAFLFAAKVGDELKLSGPFGQFHVIDSDREMVFIGGGAGMAPIRAHILHQLKTLHSQRKISFWFGARNQQEIFYQSLFDELSTEYGNFSWHLALSDEPEESDWQGERGYIHQLVERAFLAEQENMLNCEFYVCGPSAMNQAVRSVLLAAGVPNTQIVIDDFG